MAALDAVDAERRTDMLLGHCQQGGLAGRGGELAEIGAQNGTEVDRRQGTPPGDRFQSQAKTPATEPSQEAVVGQDVEQAVCGGNGDRQLSGDLASTPLGPLGSEQREDVHAFPTLDDDSTLGGALSREPSVTSPPPWRPPRPDRDRAHRRSG